MKNVNHQPKERDIDVAVATKRCHLRQSEVGSHRHNILKKGNKKSSSRMG